VVSGNGTYTASTALPTSGAVAGTYTWTAVYGGDANNNAANDQGGAAEQTVVSVASPTLTTTPSGNVTLGTTSPILSDPATLSGGYFETGTITFTLLDPSATVVDTETVTVSGNGTYSTPTGFTLPASGTVIGTYQWNATYRGDANNNTASDISDPLEQLT